MIEQREASCVCVILDFAVLSFVFSTCRCTGHRIRKLPQFCTGRGEAIWLLSTPSFPSWKNAVTQFSIFGVGCLFQWNLNQILVEDVAMSTFQELSPPVLFSGEGTCKGHFWVQKMHLPRRSLAQSNGRVAVWTVFSMCFLDSLGTDGRFSQKPQLEPNFWPCVLCEVPTAFHLFLA